MPCWRWLNSVLEEAGVEVNDENRERIDQVIHDYVVDQASHGRCSMIIEEASQQIAGDSGMRRELIDKLQQVARP
ncbi:MAG: hypothetical protein GX307_08580 [Euryarchaeota archaeon]|jgi:hypothetical protein|nr:hypothetical protein [Euryarchaeota archaeon]